MRLNLSLKLSGMLPNIVKKILSLYFLMGILKL